MNISDGNLQLHDNCLLFFLDETGHEELSDPQFPIFGFGGCAVMGERYEDLIRQPWKRLKRDVFGSANISVHAADLRNPTDEQVAALNRFFNTQNFSRYASVMKSTTVVSATMTPYQAVYFSIWKALEKIATAYSHFTSVAMIFETNDRAKAMWSEFYATTKWQINGKEIPTTICLMDKKCNEPGLEVADFIVHTSGCQVRHTLLGRTGTRRDFECVYNNVDNQFTYFMDLTSVVHNPNPTAGAAEIKQ